MKTLPVVPEQHEIRRIYDEKTETWLFSVVDIIQVLTQQPDFHAARKYWKVLKGRLAKEGSQLVTNCYQLKIAADRLELEEKTGQRVVTGRNFLPPGTGKVKQIKGPNV